MIPRDIQALAEVYGVFPTSRVKRGMTKEQACDAYKHPAVCIESWAPYATRHATDAELQTWFGNGKRYGVGLPAGQKGLICIDFDDPVTFAPWWESVKEHDAALGACVAVVKTPNGWHVWLRSTLAIRNKRIAVDRDDKTRIEIRGAGGYALVPPSEGYTLKYGDLTALPLLEREDAELLIGLARIFDERTAAEHEAKAPISRGEELRPGDVYNASADIEHLIREAGGHSPRKGPGGRIYWCRPGKARGVSLTTGNGSRCDLVVVHTTNWPGLENRCYDAFGLYAAVHHGGDLKAAAKAAARLFEMPARAPSSSTPAVTPEGLPVIQVNNRSTDTIAGQALEALALANNPRRLFARDRMLVRIVSDARGHESTELIAPPSMTGELERAARWVRAGKDSEVVVPVPKTVVEHLLYAPTIHPTFAPLEGKADCPILTAHGIVTAHGYDERSGWLVTYKGAVEPWQGTGAEAAAWLLTELLGDFPFDSEASRANALAFALGPIVRPAITGNVPACNVSAPSPGTGKSLLAEVLSIATVGSGYAITVVPTEEEELRKKIMGYLLTGVPVIIFDNLDRHLKSPSLAALLTTGVHSDRILGASEIRSVANRACWAVTANNGTFSRDLVRRMYLVRFLGLHAPESRKGFRHANLRGWARDNRPKILGALLAMCQTWIDAGRPMSGATKGSYEHWAALVGGILESCSVPGFLANDEELRQASDIDGAMWEAFVQQWYERYREDDVRLPDLLSLALDSSTLDPVFARASSDRGRSTAFGLALRKQVGKVFSVTPGHSSGDSPGELLIRESTVREGVSRFRLARSVNSWTLFHTLTRENTGTHATRKEGPGGSPVHQQVQNPVNSSKEFTGSVTSGHEKSVTSVTDRFNDDEEGDEEPVAGEEWWL